MFRIRNKEYSGILSKIPGMRMLIIKAKEAIIAYKIELLYPKNEILKMYANTVSFGNNAYGIKIAARTYFNKLPKDLTTNEAATLVGMLKATTYYNPISKPANALKRRNTVLYNMVTHNYLPLDRYKQLCKYDIHLNIHYEENYGGKAQYFRTYIIDYLKDWLKENDYDIYSSGLKIYTTIDTRLQKYAEEAAIKQMKKIQHEFDNHWRGQEPWRDPKGNVIPGFIESIAQRQPFYKALLKKYHNQPDSIQYYLNKPHKVKLFDFEKGTIEKQMSSMDSIRYMVKFMHCAMVALEPQTGAVKAWVGDIDFKSWKYDKVVAERQPGSTFKLFVYSEAMNQGLTPCDKRRDEYIRMEVLDKRTGKMKTWIPHNANGRYSGDSIPLKAAFARSINTIAVRLGQEMGIKNIIRTAKDMGIKSPLDDEPSLALGSSDVNLLELTNAYCTVANNGEQHEPVLITKIVDKDGNEVYHGPTEHTQAIPYKTAFFMQELLKGGLTEPGGTSRTLNQYIFKDTDWGGKTGTSNNHSDAWFVAVSPRLVVGAWVGGEYRSIHFRTGALGQGSKTALPICGNFIYSVMRDKAFNYYHAKWKKPSASEIDPSEYTCPSYVTATPRVISDSAVIHRNENTIKEEDDENENEENDEQDPLNTDKQNADNNTPSNKNKVNTHSNDQGNTPTRQKDHKNKVK